MDHINKTLEELYQLDPELKEHEIMLKNALGTLLASKPATGFDPAFARRLKAELADRAATSSHTGFITNLRTMLRLNKMALMGGFAGILAIALVATNIPFHRNPQLAFAYEITPVGKMAFGSLTGTQTGAREVATPTDAAVPSAASMVASGMGGSTTGAAAPAMDKRIANSASSMIVAPDMYRPITYRYTGDELPTLSSDQLEVFKRLKPSAGISINDLGGLSNSLVNLGSFSNASARNIEIVEDKDKGYIINLSLTEGVVSISQNWEKWNTCPNGICPELAPLTQTDIPSDESLIAIANNFLSSHGISTQGYSAPQVEAQPRYYLMDARPTAESSTYVPDTMNVVYPLTLKGQTVYEMGSSPIGIRVSINIRDKQVIGAWDIRSNQYQSSLYDVETDTARLIRIAEQGGNLYGSSPVPENAITLELGTPTIGLARTWHPINNGMSQEELFVPVYIFPVKPLSDANAKLLPSYYYQPTSIMVPLVKELLVDADKPLPTPQPIPVDAMIKTNSVSPVSNPPAAMTEPAMAPVKR